MLSAMALAMALLLDVLGRVVKRILIVTPYVGPASFIVAPVTTGVGVRVCTKKLFMMIVLCGVE